MRKTNSKRKGMQHEETVGQTKGTNMKKEVFPFCLQTCTNEGGLSRCKVEKHVTVHVAHYQKEIF